jgi:hypothetical protein
MQDVLRKWIRNGGARNHLSIKETTHVIEIWRIERHCRKHI